MGWGFFVYTSGFSCLRKPGQHGRGGAGLGTAWPAPYLTLPYLTPPQIRQWMVPSYLASQPRLGPRTNNKKRQQQQQVWTSPRGRQSLVPAPFPSLPAFFHQIFSPLLESTVRGDFQSKNPLAPNSSRLVTCCDPSLIQEVYFSPIPRNWWLIVVKSWWGFNRSFLEVNWFICM